MPVEQAACRKPGECCDVFTCHSSAKLSKAMASGVRWKRIQGGDAPNAGRIDCRSIIAAVLQLIREDFDVRI